jgi:hypothetical protein
MSGITKLPSGSFKIFRSMRGSELEIGHSETQYNILFIISLGNTMCWLLIPLGICVSKNLEVEELEK